MDNLITLSVPKGTITAIVTLRPDGTYKGITFTGTSAKDSIETVQSSGESSATTES